MFFFQIIGTNVELEQRFNNKSSSKKSKDKRAPISFPACPKRPPFDPTSNPLLPEDGPVFRVTPDGGFDSHAVLTSLQASSGGPARIRVAMRCGGGAVVACDGLVSFRVPILVNFPGLKPSNEALGGRTDVEELFRD